jgi:membrane protein
MRMKSKVFLYIISEAISRGIPQLILVILALLMPKDDFAIFILIYGLESLIVLLLPSNYVEILYVLQKKISQKRICNSILTVNFIITIALVLIYAIFMEKVNYFYGYSNYIVFVFIIISAFVNSFMRFYRVQLQILLEHTTAIKNMFYSFGLSNVCIVLFLLFFDDKVFAFFVGKAFGLIMYMGYLSYKEKFQFHISKPILAYFAIRIKYLFLFAIYSWVFGYGFIYIIKIIGAPDDVANIGYIITFSTPFLLLANGINQVYAPKLKQLLSINFFDGLLFSKKVMLLYIAMSAVIILAAYLISFIDFDVLNKYSMVILISSIVFGLSIYKYVYEVYLYINDLFRAYVFGTIFIETFTLLCIIFVYKVYEINIIYLYPVLIFSRNIYVHLLMVKIKRLNIENY